MMSRPYYGPPGETTLTDWELQFHGTNAEGLLTGLLVAITGALLAAGVYHLRGGRRRLGWFTLAAAGTPLMLAGALLVDAALLHKQGNSIGRRRRVFAASGALMGLVLVAGFVAIAGRSTPAIWLAIIGTQILVTVTVFYLPLIARVGARSMTSLTILRSVTILVLLLVLFKPAFAFFGPTQDRRPTLSILVDCSGSMGVRDDKPSPRLRRVLASLTSQQDRLAQHYQIEWIGIADGLLPEETLADLAQYTPPHEGDDATHLAAGLRYLAQEGTRAILISDGRDTTGTPLAPLAERLTQPLYTVGVGPLVEPAGQANASLKDITTPLIAADGDLMIIEGTLVLTDLARSPVKVRLLDEDTGRVLDTQTFWADGPLADQPIRFEWQARSLPSTDDTSAPTSPVRKLAVDIPALEGERTTDDNRWPIHVVITHPSLRVLYVEGVVRPEFKWLRRLLTQQTDLQCVTMVRVDEQRFWVQGSAGTTAPTGLPTSVADLADFDVVILGDMPRELWSRAQLEVLETFVREGGGLIAMAGQHTLSDPSYANTGLEELLPVAIDAGGTQDFTPFLPVLTSEGENHPIFRGLTPFPDGTEGDIPPLTGSVIVPSLKPGATVLAVNPTVMADQSPTPVLVVQSYGAGRSAAFTADTTWRWRLRDVQVEDRRLYDAFWMQMVRWLGGEDPTTREPAPAIAMVLHPPYSNAGEEISLLAHAVDDRGDAIATRLVRCEVARPSGELYNTFTLEASRLGALAGSFDTDDAGDWTVTVSLLAGPEASDALATDTMTLHVHQPAPEMERLACDDVLLESLAQTTGGYYTPLLGLPDLVDTLLLERGREPVEASVSLAPLYHFPILFIVFVVTITTEWSLRRKWQLA
jgi:uncharacterized membrane protein